jgi:puromycin-sensitive aminopeptidase
LSLLRPVVISSLGQNGDAEVIAEAKRRFADREKTAIPADLRHTVYKLVVGNGSTAEWEDVLKIYRTAEMSEEKIRALRALGKKNGV